MIFEIFSHYDLYLTEMLYCNKKASIDHASPSPVPTGEALSARYISFPATAEERSTSSNHTAPFVLCSWEVFPYDLLPAQLHPSGLLLGQVSKWRAQRADLCNRPLFYIVSLIVQSSSTSEADAARISPS